jgi:putative peptidoglycan lipid II flippase
VFSVAISTVLFPTMSRFAARGAILDLRKAMALGLRQINILLIPSGAFIVVLCTPIIRLVYEHGSFGEQSTELVSTALFWFAFSLPFSGMNLLLTRTYFSLQKTWYPTVIAVGGLLVNLVVSLALYKPYGIAGLVVGTALSNAATTLLQAYGLRPLLGGSIEGRETVLHIVAMTIAAVLMGAVTYLVWTLVDSVVGRSLLGQLISMGFAGAAAIASYTASVLWLDLAEARQVQELILRRLGRGR